MSSTVNPRRALKAAQQELNEAVEHWVAATRTRTDTAGTAGRSTAVAMVDAANRLRSAWDAFDEARRNLEGAGPAAKRHTSIATAHTALPNKGTHRRDVINAVTTRHLLYGHGCTTEEIEGLTRKSHQSISSAVNYCEQAGWIKDSGETRLTRFGRKAIVYVPTELAIAKVREEAEAR